MWARRNSTVRNVVASEESLPAQHWCIHANCRHLQLQATGLRNLFFGLAALADVSHLRHFSVQVWPFVMRVSELKLFSSPQHFPSLEAPVNALALVCPVLTLMTFLLCYMRAPDPDLWVLDEVSCCCSESKTPLWILSLCGCQLCLEIWLKILISLCKSIPWAPLKILP